MKRWNWLSFIIGLVLGCVITIGIGVYTVEKHVPDQNNKYNVPGLVMLKENEKGSTFEAPSIKVMQTLSPKLALAHTGVKKSYSEKPVYMFGTLILFIAPDDIRLYDDQVIEIPNGKTLVHVGTFEYTTKEKIQKTVPAVTIK